MAYKPATALTLAFDVQKIYYSDCKSVTNPLLADLMTSQLGEENGAGFGWQDTTVFEGGVQWQMKNGGPWRAGYSNGKQPIPESEVLFNILAPGVIEQHATLGFTKIVGSGNEINFALMRGFSESISGPNPLEAPRQQTVELKMNQWEVEVGFSS